MEIRLFYLDRASPAPWRAAVLGGAWGPVLYQTGQYADFPHAVETARRWMRELYPEQDCRCVLVGPDPGRPARASSPQQPAGKGADHA